MSALIYYSFSGWNVDMENIRHLKELTADACNHVSTNNNNANVKARADRWSVKQLPGPWRIGRSVPHTRTPPCQTSETDSASAAPRSGAAAAERRMEEVKTRWCCAQVCVHQVSPALIPVRPASHLHHRWPHSPTQGLAVRACVLTRSLTTAMADVVGHTHTGREREDPANTIDCQLTLLQHECPQTWKNTTKWKLMTSMIKNNLPSNKNNQPDTRWSASPKNTLHIYIFTILQWWRKMFIFFLKWGGGRTPCLRKNGRGVWVHIHTHLHTHAYTVVHHNTCCFRC